MSDSQSSSSTGSPHTVSDVMTHTVVAVGREAPFKEIVELLGQWKVSAVPVLAGEGRVIGVVSEADLLPKGSSAMSTTRSLTVTAIQRSGARHSA